MAKKLVVTANSLFVCFEKLSFAIEQKEAHKSGISTNYVLNIFDVLKIFEYLLH